MNRRQLAFIILVNAIVSLTIALAVAWIIEWRRPDPEELAALYASRPQAIVAATPVPGSVASVPTPVTAQELAPAPTNTPASISSEERTIYVVQSGDSLSSIAERHNVSIQTIMEINELDDPNFVFVGQRLALPVDSVSAVLSNPSSNENTQTTAQGTGTQEGLQITAIRDAGNVNGETVVIVNESDTPYNLQGWTVGREEGPVYTFGNFPLFPGGSVQLHSGTGSDTSIDLYWGVSEAVWPAGTTARLANSQGELVYSYTVP